MIGFLVGYVMGTKAGEEGYQELRDAWREIASSGELKEILGAAGALLGDVVRNGKGLLGEDHGRGLLRRVA
jgi:hypothetical protein